MNQEFKQKSFSQKIKFICSITIKNDGRALDIIFILCLISIIAFCVFLYRSSTDFYNRIDETMQNSMNMNLEAMQNDYIEQIQDYLNQISQNREESNL